MCRHDYVGGLIVFLILTLLDGTKTLVNTDQVLHIFECEWGTILCFESERVTVKESLESITETMKCMQK